MWRLIPLSLLCVEYHTFIQLAKDGAALSACLSASTFCSIWYSRDRIMTKYKAGCGRQVTPEPVYPAISTCLMVPKLQLPEHTLKLSPLFDFPALTFFFFPLLHLFCVLSPPQRQAKYSENKLKCTKARNDYLLNLAATNAVVAKYYIHDVSDMIDVSICAWHMCLFTSLSWDFWCWF